MHLAAFLIAGPVAHSHALWRHPATTADFLAAESYQAVARILERGKFDLAFFADRLAMADTYGHSLETGVTFGDQDALRLDPIPVLAMMAAVTDRLGLGATRSTTYYHPYHIARTFATLDHLSNGRAAWNAVTSPDAFTGENFRRGGFLDRDDRYRRAEEFVDVARQLWDTWGDDAVVADRERGVLVEQAAIRPFHHHGNQFSIDGTFDVTRSPQGHPVFIQAGDSDGGRELAAKRADVIFSRPSPLGSTMQPVVSVGACSIGEDW